MVRERGYIVAVRFWVLVEAVVFSLPVLGLQMWVEVSKCRMSDLLNAHVVRFCRYAMSISFVV